MGEGFPWTRLDSRCTLLKNARCRGVEDPKIWTTLLVEGTVHFSCENPERVSELFVCCPGSWLTALFVPCQGQVQRSKSSCLQGFQTQAVSTNHVTQHLCVHVLGSGFPYRLPIGIS
jgi:hypothetical protein